MEAELAAAAKAARWVVAYGHRPLYCSSHGGQDIPKGNVVLRAAIEDQLYHSAVDLVIQVSEAARLQDERGKAQWYQDSLVGPSALGTTTPTPDDDVDAVMWCCALCRNASLVCAFFSSAQHTCAPCMRRRTCTTTSAVGQFLIIR